ncbi:hypothetical protein [Novosphingobium sp. Leaf2]|uniref:hypothetical protein n=1 Tax=Novosphingobium sp. Leaf2 TaxID=1735670 RepID=UPI0006F2FB57|nr:hypothetical protein [Novosphingobium sp. Leaf2]KQM19522.1 hypothetical protein ASE49_04660 [Novosphingobium sp. Leaf2]
MATTHASPGTAHTDARALLARYPHLDVHELAQLEHWFRKEASALDVGLLASEADLAAQFRAYRKDHHDRFTARDILIATAFVAVAATLVGAMLIMVP